MTKLQTIEAEFNTLPVDEQREFISRYVHLTEPIQGEYIFSDEEWADIDNVIKNDTGSFTVEEVFESIREKYASGTTKQ